MRSYAGWSWWILGILAVLVNAVNAWVLWGSGWCIFSLVITGLGCFVLLERLIYIILRNRRIRRGDDYDEN